MSFRLQTAEPVPEGIRRIAAEQIADAVQELTDQRSNRHKAIHSARQRCKRVRAVLRLVRADLGGRYSEENRRFRDIARQLSDVRDAEAVIEAVDKLYADCKNQREIDLLRAVRRMLTARRAQILASEKGLDTRVAEVVAALREAGEEVTSWPLSKPDFDLLEPGIQEAYAGTRKAFFAAYCEPSNVRFHEARKRIKYHWYHMRIVHNIWPEMLRAYRRSLKRLSDRLGDDHDLTVMRAIVLEHTNAFSDARDLRDTLSLVERRRTQFRAQAHVLGRRVFAEKPACFRRRLAQYWEAWHEETHPPTEGEFSEVDQRAVA